MPATLLVAGGMAVFPSVPATASCHVASYAENEATVAEASPGYVELTVELEGSGPVTCNGSIKWKTSNGSAKAGSDYKGAEGELTWNATSGVSRSKTFRIEILDNKTHEASETFTVTLSADPSSGIQPEGAGPAEGGPKAVVTIRDDDKAASTPPAGTSSTTRPGSGQPGASASPSADATTSASASAQATTAAPGGTPAPGSSIDGTSVAAPAAPDGGGKSVAGAVAALLALGAAGAYLLQRRRT